MIGPFARSALAPLLGQALGAVRAATDLAEERAMRGTVRVATVFALAFFASASGVIAVAFLALAIHRRITHAYDPVAADVALFAGFLVLAFALLFVLRRMTRPPRHLHAQRPAARSAAPPPPAGGFARGGFARGNANRSAGGPRARPFGAGAPRERPPMDEPAEDELAPPPGPAPPSPATVAGAMAAALVVGILLGRR